MIEAALRHGLRRAATIGLSFALAVAALAAVPGQSRAEWKPTRTVTLVVPYSPGGGTDVMARKIADQLSRMFGQSVIVDNRPGAGGLIGTERVVNAEPDGHTLLVQLPSLVLLKYLPGFRGDDPVSKLMPVTAYSQYPGVWVAHPDVPGKDFREMMAKCRTASEPCKFGSTENTAWLRLSMLKDTVLPSMIILNYKGGGQLMPELLNNSVNIASMGYTAALPHLQAGRVKAVMVGSGQRSPVLPDVPSAREQGFPELESMTWFGLFAPLGTPKEVIGTLAAAVGRALDTDEVKKTFGMLGAESLRKTPGEFGEMVKKADEEYKALTARYPL
jgi:tripartite-type tricarboxylate transporter receptor subunit TctC